MDECKPLPLEHRDEAGDGPRLGHHLLVLGLGVAAQAAFETKV